MTVPQQTPYSLSTGNGVTTVFPYQFLILDEDDLAVYVDGVVKTLNADYTVSGVGVVAGGSVTFLTGAPANGSIVSRVREMLIERVTEYQQAGDFLASTVNPDFDRPILLLQDMSAQLNRTIRTPADEVGTLPTLPSIANRNGRYLGFDALGQPIASVGTGNDLALRTDLASAVAGAEGALLVGFRQAGLGAVARTSRAKLRETVSVYDFGAVGDGVTNDRAAWQAAVDYLVSVGGGTLRAPRGTFLLNSTVSISGAISGVHIVGDGADATIIVNGITGAAAQPLFSVVASGNYFVFDMLEIRGNNLTGAAGNGNAVSAINPGGVLFPQHVVLRDVVIRDHKGTGRDYLGNAIPACGFYGYKSTGFVFDHTFIYQCNHGVRLREIENAAWEGGGIDACLANCIWLDAGCHDLKFSGANFQNTGAGAATDGILYLTDCELIQFVGCEFKNGNPYLVNTQGAAQINHSVLFKGCGLAQLDLAMGHTAVRLGNASTNFSFEDCRFNFVNTMADAKGIEVVQVAGGWSTTGLRIVGNSFKIGTGGTIAACVHLNVTGNRVIAPVIESNEFGWQDPTGGATVITDAILLDGRVEGGSIRNNAFMTTANVTITDALHINSVNVLGLKLENNEYQGFGVITNQVNNSAAVHFERRDRVNNGNMVMLVDSVATVPVLAGQAIIFVDNADGDLKVRFGDGVLKTIVVDT